MNEIVIRAENLSKVYRIVGGPQYGTLRDTITEAFSGIFRRRKDIGISNHNSHTWSLKEVSFEINKGEVIGFIGHNGAGKSTILKILSRITPPSSGYAKVIGRVGSLLEVGTGFHMELSGRENIYLNGAILGMKRNEIKAKFDEIVSFSEVERFIDTPIKHYSSGMYVRLAFAVAAHLQTDILLIDEVLSVGDVAFQKKCLGKIEEGSKSGRTILFVSHNMSAVNQLCQRAIWIDNGQIKMSGPAQEIVSSYLSSGIKGDAEFRWAEGHAPGNEDLTMRAVRITDKDGNISSNVDIDSASYIEFEYEVNRSLSGHALRFVLNNANGVTVLVSDDSEAFDLKQDRYLEKGVYKSICKLPVGVLNSGEYIVNIALYKHYGEIVFSLDGVLKFHAFHNQFPSYANIRSAGVICPFLEWKVQKL